MSRPITTLFMLMSVDGKISTGAADCLDVDTEAAGVPDPGGLLSAPALSGDRLRQ